MQTAGIILTSMEMSARVSAYDLNILLWPAIARAKHAMVGVKINVQTAMMENTYHLKISARVSV